MKKILVFGGTRFFGKKLVETLVAEGHEVTIATRGKTAHSFGDKVDHVIVDRTNKRDLATTFKNSQWDIIYDNICFSPNDALAACEIFNGNTKKYVFTSTMSTYLDLGANLSEGDFDPYNYEIRNGSVTDFSYGEGKRQAEAVFFQKAEFPVVAVRFPIVLGEDDYTRRLHFHIERVSEEKVISFLNMEARMSYILSDDAGRFLQFAGFSGVEGPFNATSTGTYSLKELMEMIEWNVGKKAKIALVGDEESRSPFAVPKDWYMSQAKSIQAGFTCQSIEAWLPDLVETLSQQVK
ncbi:NAD-dependent epimerase/dehydratase family protein [Lysinibacillus sp. SGAir0095]|uniref:NAD-dependent epimerase/dehydratase family protein n=1 Tax=Lysinibacillus sp. SGAir0095 TaxID=2070463 RepID=UPI0010CD0AAD|nr:NAD-dependent epimerase/dehydratase family protein [Lysinibacillus sp. SGAir0095]QCR33049.1 NAD-dependent dehydratase [Lysinibacillus sp. SGAir0095]